MVAAGQVRVDGQAELRKRCKIRAGQLVSVGGRSIRVVAGVEADSEQLGKPA